MNEHIGEQINTNLNTVYSKNKHGKMQTCINNKYLNMSVQSFISEFIGIILNLFEDDPLSLSLNEYVCKDVALVFIAAYSYACGVCVHFFYYFTIVFTTTYPSIYTYTFTWPCIHISIYIVICTLYINVYLTTKKNIYTSISESVSISNIYV